MNIGTMSHVGNHNSLKVLGRDIWEASLYHSRQGRTSTTGSETIRAAERKIGFTGNDQNRASEGIDRNDRANSECFTECQWLLSSLNDVRQDGRIVEIRLEELVFVCFGVCGDYMSIWKVCEAGGLVFAG